MEEAALLPQPLDHARAGGLTRLDIRWIVQFSLRCRDRELFSVDALQKGPFILEIGALGVIYRGEVTIPPGALSERDKRIL